MVDHLFVFEGEGAIKDIIGNYTEYRKQTAADYKKEKQEIKDGEPAKQVKVTQLSESSEKPTEKRKLSFKEKEEFKQAEKDMEILEVEKEELTNKLSDSSLSNEELMNAGIRLSEVVSKLETATDRWLELSEFI
jgi:ATP-binding cassette subfamily F protein uup